MPLFLIPIWMAVKPWLEIIGKVISFLMRIIIPVPVLICLIIAGIWWWERDHAMVKYAEQQIKELVAGAELEALRLDAQIQKDLADEQKRIADDEKERADSLAAANAQFEKEQTESTETIDQLEAQLEKAKEEAAAAAAEEEEPDVVTPEEPQVCVSTPSKGRGNTISNDFFNSVRDK